MTITKRGRPRKPASQRKSAQIVVRCLPDELKAWHAAAKKEDVRLCDWLRGVANQALGAR